MPLDTFICGSCMVSFTDIEQFIIHKNEMCGSKSAESGETLQLQVQPATSDEPMTDLSAGQEMIVTGHVPEIMEVTHDDTVSLSTATLPHSETLLADTSELFQSGNLKTVIILEGDLPTLSLENAGKLLAGVTHEHANTDVLAGMYKKRGRPGRPRKVKTEEAPKPEIKEKNEPEIGEDGKLTCKRCKKSFTRERVFNAHRCIALSEYVDFTTKGVPNVDPDDLDLPQDDLEDAGALEMDTGDSEFKMPATVVRDVKGEPGGRGDGRDEVRVLAVEDGHIVMKTRLADGNKTTDEASKNEGVSEASEDADAALQEAAERAEQTLDSDDREIASTDLPVQLEGGPDGSAEQVKRTERIGTVPMFLSEEDKATFEACLNVDLSGVDSMYRTHCIAQELNQNVQASSRFSSTELSLYSCNTCDKVFKSIPHMRFHVLTHTDLKPFRCFKCSFSTNSRGNLYTHMRKHTGQFYHCDKCKFKTVNKSHLLEHQQTHAGKKEQCSICKKMYNTQKSLMSHVRKYHDTPKGKAYLATFLQSRDIRGTTIIHQCHVCNRKFKKKTDRDRHLFVHDIKDAAVIQHCDLCNYSASRVKYLEKHFQKHRCIYRCCKCEAMFLSSVKLVTHLTVSHTESGNSLSWDQLFEDSIARSVFLPEPDAGMTAEEKSVDNLPEELSEASLNEGWKLHNSGEDYLPPSSADLYINKEPAVTVETNDMTDQGQPVANHVSIETTEASDVHAQESMSGLNTLANSVSDMAEERHNVAVGESSSSQAAGFAEHMDTDNDEQNKQLQFNSAQTEADGTNRAADTASSLHSNGADASLEMAGNEEMSSDAMLQEALEPVQDQNDDLQLNNGSEAPILEETNLTEEELLGRKKTMSAKKLMEKLGYQSMTLKVFQKMRDTFGSEECEYCGRLFFSKTDYEPHVRTHTGDKPFLCPKCGYRSITRENLRRHIEKEHMKITYPCRDCAYVAYTRTQLWNHAMKHKGLKGLECPSCREQFDTMTELKEHADRIHPNANIEELDKLLSNKHKLRGKIGRRSYKCPHCDKVFLRASSELQKHMWIHEGIKPFKCPLCPYACRSKNNLQAHMLRHSKDKPFLCGDCGKAYKSKTALRWHVRSHFSGKMFKCERCPYEATQRSHLKRHMETHEVIKRYMCGECQFSANTLGFLKIHYARFHKGVDASNLIGVAPESVQISQDVHTYKCLSCNYLFGNLSDLKRHLKTRHHVNVKDLQQVNENQTELQVVQLMEGEGGGTEDQTQVQVLQDASTATVTDENLDEKTASAVTILQQIIGMSQPGSVGQEVECSTVVNPETIIVQQDNEMYETSTAEIDGNHYVIQYVPQTEGVEDMNVVEIQGSEVEAEVLTDAQILQ